MMILKDLILEGRKTDITIKDNIIESTEPVNTDHIKGDIVNCNGLVAIPGFVNMHTHAAMTLMRGIGEDMSLMKWLHEKIWPTEKRLNDELVYWGTKLACLEMIQSGTTCFNDQYWNLPVAVKAAKEMGLRSVQPFVILDLNDKSRASQIKDECLKMYQESLSWGELNRFAIGVHAPYSVSEEMIIWASEFAKKNNLLLHIHLSETEFENNESLRLHGKSPAAYMESIGALGPNVIAAHSLWLSDDDIEILAKYDVKCVHNINSNLKIASGYKFRYKELKDAGITVSLGTDGCASSNNLDMIETMKTTALVQKAWRFDPTAMPLDDLLDTATLNGAKSLGLKSGKIASGYLADIALINTQSAAFTPNINFKANLIYSANSSCVDTVVCNGKIVMRGREVNGEREIIEQVNRLYKQLIF